MRRAFTILELIFVIVILGVLAALALPKLSTSKDEAEVSKALNNLRTAISDINLYALKNDALTYISQMSNVSSLENVDLSNFNGVVSAKFKVGNDENCLEFVFVNESNVLVFGISSNANTKTLISNIASLQNQVKLNPNDTALKRQLQSANDNLLNASFASTSTNKACTSLVTQSTFKDLASKTYILLGN